MGESIAVISQSQQRAIDRETRGPLLWLLEARSGYQIAVGFHRQLR